MFSAATALSTWVRVGWSANVTVNSVPPAKSMPSRKPWVAIEMMPGMMITSESRKNELRLPMTLRRRVRGSGGSSATAVFTGSAGTMSAAWASAVMSDVSDTVDPQQEWLSHAACRQHDGEKVVRHDDRRDEAEHDTDAQRDGKSFHLRRADEAEDDAGDKGRGVGVSDRGPGSADSRVDRCHDGSPRPDLFFESFEDQHVGVDRHTYRQDEPGDAGQGERHRYDLADGQHRACIKETGQARHQSGHAVVDDHEDDDDREADKAGGQAYLDGLGAQGRADLGDVEDLQVDGQRPRVDAGGQVVGALLGEAARDHGLSAGDRVA